MVGTAAQIERDITALNTTVSQLADSLHSAYSSYLTGLGQASRQQLMLACYHICTQGHPDRFLHLSYNQRQQLQQTLKGLARQVQEELLASLVQPGVELLPDRQPAVAGAPDPDGTVLFRPDADIRLEPSFFLPPMPSAPVVPPSEQKILLTPMVLNQWQQELEQAIAEVLRTTSHAANRILQQTGILSQALPEAILDIAAHAEGADMGGHIPNVVSLMMSEGMGELLGERGSHDRAKGDRPSRDRPPDDPADRPRAEGEAFHIDLSALTDAHSKAVVHLLAIHLNLAEIEFGDASVTIARTQIRHLLAELRNLGREYQKKLKERAIASAQAAWRSSWTED